MTFAQRWGRWLALALVPVIDSSLFSEGRELPRALLIAAIAAIGLGSRVREGRIYADAGWIRAAVVFGAAMLGEAVFADSPARSLFGAYEGHQGVLAWCGALMLVASAPGPETRLDACRVAFVLGIGEAALGLSQFLRDRPPTGTLGHAMFLSLFLTLAALAGLGIVLDAATKRWHLAAIAGVGFITFVEVLAARRMPVAALLAGTALVVAGSARRSRLVAAVALMVLAVLVGAGVHRPASTEYLAERITSAFDVGAYGGPGDRLDFYRVALSAWREHPWLGWGFGAFRDLYAERKAPGVTHFEARVHDLPLELLLALGLLGMIALLPLVASTLRRWQATWRERGDDGTLLACLAVGPAYALCLLTNFDQPGVTAWGFSLAAFPLLGAPWAPRYPWRWMTAAAGLVLGWLPAAAGDVLAKRGVDEEKASHRDAALTAFRDAVVVAPYEELYRLRLAVSLRGASVSGTAAERLAVLEEGLRRTPRSPFVHEHLAIALEDSGQRAAGLEERRRAEAMAPGFPAFHDGVARVLFEEGQLAAALDEMNTAVSLDGWDPRWHQDRGNVLASLGRAAEARADHDEAARLEALGAKR